jgi:hypothetical protein
MSNDKYRKKLFAILEGIEMPEHERLLLIGGLVIEIQSEKGPELARCRGQARSAQRVYAAWRELYRAMDALGNDLEIEES